MKTCDTCIYFKSPTGKMRAMGIDNGRCSMQNWLVSEDKECCEKHRPRCGR